MQYRKLGRSGIDASAVAFGAWAIGGWMWGGSDDDAAIEAIRAARDAGINFIDTAAIYGFGHSEEVVGRAIKGRREDFIVATKCGLVWHTDQGQLAFESDERVISQGGPRKVYKFLGPDSIRHEVDQSLQRLQTDYIDLYQTHWQDETTPMEDTMATLLELKDAGKIRAIGHCNLTSAQLATYTAVGPVDSAQLKYSMLDRGIEEDQLPYCRENDIAVLAYSPLELGLLTGKTTPDREFQEGDLRRNHPRFSVENREKVQQMLGEMKPVRDAHGITCAQLAIAWTIAQAGLTHALVGARNPKQAQENAAAADVQLTEPEIEKVNAAVAGYRERGGV
jgi:aryl-alcohol dehydrogenase-like predicted oxidoreductase